MKPPSRAVSCAGKFRHDTKEQAMRQLVSVKTQRGGKDGLRMEAYKCHYCGGFHIGHGRKV